MPLRKGLHVNFELSQLKGTTTDELKHIASFAQGVRCYMPKWARPNEVIGDIDAFIQRALGEGLQVTYSPTDVRSDISESGWLDLTKHACKKWDGDDVVINTYPEQFDDDDARAKDRTLNQVDIISRHSSNDIIVEENGKLGGNWRACDHTHTPLGSVTDRNIYAGSKLYAPWPFFAGGAPWWGGISRHGQIFNSRLMDSQQFGTWPSEPMTRRTAMKSSFLSLAIQPACPIT